MDANPALLGRRQFGGLMLGAASFATLRPGRAVAEDSLDEICVVACAEAWRGDGEIFASGMGTIPMLAARLARASFEPDLLVSDGEAYFVANDLPLGAGHEAKLIEGWIPFRSVFDTLWSGVVLIVLVSVSLYALVALVETPVLARYAPDHVRRAR